MKTFNRTITSLVLAAMLASCNSFIAAPTMSQADIMETAIATVSTAFAETQRAIPTATPGLLLLPTIAFDTLTPYPTPPARTPLPTILTFTPLVFSDPSIPLSRRIVYYHLVWAEQGPVPEGTVRAVHLFAPAYTDETFTSDTAADLRRALEIILHEDIDAFGTAAIWKLSKLRFAMVTQM